MADSFSTASSAITLVMTVPALYCVWQVVVKFLRSKDDLDKLPGRIFNSLQNIELLERQTHHFEELIDNASLASNPQVEVLRDSLNQSRVLIASASEFMNSAGKQVSHLARWEQMIRFHHNMLFQDLDKIESQMAQHTKYW